MSAQVMMMDKKMKQVSATPQGEVTEEYKQQMEAYQDAQAKRQQQEARTMQLIISTNFQILANEAGMFPGALIAGVSAGLADVLLQCTNDPVNTFKQLMNDRLKQLREEVVARQLRAQAEAQQKEREAEAQRALQKPEGSVH